ncbi:MAG: polysaccharide deacetylase family protein [Phototrophicaceae bacterium]
MRKKQLLAQGLRYSGALSLLNHAWWGEDRLTVLAYHRITDIHADDFYGLASNVSATPEDFDAQMTFIGNNFNVISLDQLREFILNDTALPKRPLLITFDDGYRDNYDNALPILKKHGFPAVIFTVTGRMTDPLPLWWDMCAQAFRETTLKTADLPYIGVREISEASQDEFIEVIKTHPTKQMDESIEKLCTALEVTPSKEALFFGWDEVRELVANGVACQPHTVNHPIMTRIDLAQRIEELTQSRDDLLQHTEQIVDTFAYPNGSPVDYDKETILALRDLGYKIAVTLSPGPERLETVKRYPLQIRRVYLSNRDTLDIFATKVMGIPALTTQDSYLEI